MIFIILSCFHSPAMEMILTFYMLRSKLLHFPYYPIMLMHFLYNCTPYPLEVADDVYVYSQSAITMTSYGEVR